MIKLGNVELSNDILQHGIEGEPKVTTKSVVTLNGSTVYVMQQIDDCKSIDLYGNENTGWVTYKVYQDLLHLSMNKDGIYDLIYENYQTKVRFRYEDPPVVTFTPLIPRPNVQDNDLGYIYIKLKEV